jgi:hypothetical protein
MRVGVFDDPVLYPGVLVGLLLFFFSIAEAFGDIRFLS